jgi:RecJ-like exonuclease
MTVWICYACKAHGEVDGDIDTCPKCGGADKSRWCCTGCWTEGRGPRPDVCPECFRSDSWYVNGLVNDPRSMHEIFVELFSMMGPTN